MNNITIAKLPRSKVEIKVEIPTNDFKNFCQKALDEFVKETEIDGFRKGIAPKEMVKTRIGSEKILDRAATLAIETTFPEAVGQNNLLPLGYPEINVLKLAEGNPLEYKATFAVYPRVELPDYKQIAAGFELKPVEVTQEDIKRLRMEKENHSRQHLRQDVLDALSQKTMVEIPEIMIEQETKKAISELKDRVPRMFGVAFEEYLKKLGKTEEELKKDIAKDNEQKIKNYLVLEEIAKREKIEVGNQEVESAIKKEYGDNKPVSSDDHDHIKKSYHQDLKIEKTFEKLESYFKKNF